MMMVEGSVDNRPTGLLEVWCVLLGKTNERQKSESAAQAQVRISFWKES